MKIVEEFVAHYRREYDFYREAARECAQQCEAALERMGIRAMITAREKRPDRLEQKLKQRAITKQYQSFDDIYADIADLAGTRIALYFPDDRHEVDRIIRAQFELMEPPKEFPPPTSQNTVPSTGSSKKYRERFSGYFATHYRVHLKPDTLGESEKRYVDARIEIQVA